MYVYHVGRFVPHRWPVKTRKFSGRGNEAVGGPRVLLRVVSVRSICIGDVLIKLILSGRRRRGQLVPLICFDREVAGAGFRDYELYYSYVYEEGIA